jgi:tetratricopeptide (TPR) repeat protein
LKDNSELVRAAAAGLWRDVAPVSKTQILKPLFTDPVRVVRQAAAIELAGSDPAGLSQAEMDALRKAMGEYQASRAANADMPESHMAIAGLALSMRNWPAAEAAFNEAAALDPQLDSSWLMLARLRSALGDEKGAANYLEKGFSYQPRSIDLMFEQAGLESRRGDDKRAIGWYQRIVALDAARPDAWLGMAFAAIRARDMALALDATAKVLDLEPNNVDALVAKSIAHYSRGEITNAKEIAAKARQISPTLQLPAELEALIKVP